MDESLGGMDSLPWKNSLYIFILFSLLLSFMIYLTGRSVSDRISEDVSYQLEDLTWEEVIEQAQKEGTVIFPTWWGEAFYVEAAQRFHDRYGIKVELLIQDLESIVHRIINEKENPQGNIDIFMGGFAGHLKTIVDADVLLPGMSRIPHWELLDPFSRSIQKNLYVQDYMIPMYRNQVAFLYNPEKVPEPPRSWEDFNRWIQEHPGRFVFSALKGGSGEAFKHTVVYQLTGGGDSYRTGAPSIDAETVKDWPLAWEWFRQNRPYYRFTESNHDSISMIESGEAWLTPAFVDDSFIAMNNGLLNRSMKLYIPDFGLFRGSDAAGILKNAPHKAAALLFISFLTEPDIQELMMERIGSDSVRTDLEVTDIPLLPPSEREFAIDHIDPVYYLYLASEFQKEVLSGDNPAP